MLDFPKWKIWGIVATILVGFLFAAPNFISERQAAALPDMLPSKQLSLGLDLRGGSHLMLEASTEDVRKTKLESLEDTVRSELRQVSGGAIAYTDISTAGGKLSLVITDPSRLDAAVAALRKVTQPISGLTGVRDVDVNVVDGNKIVLNETDAGVAASIDNAMAQAVEVIRKRIDELGTREPTIVRQGASRIVVQVPGLQDPAALKALLGKTAKLEFKLVDVLADPTEVAQGRAPPGSQILPSLEGQPVVVKRRAIISGDQLIDSQVSQDQNGAPAVSFQPSAKRQST